MQFNLSVKPGIYIKQMRVFFFLIIKHLLCLIINWYLYISYSSTRTTYSLIMSRNDPVSRDSPKLYINEINFKTQIKQLLLILVANKKLLKYVL